MPAIMDRAYIISTPCSGKSTFVASHENEYKMLHIFDDVRIQSLQHLPVHSCILGGNHIPDREEYIYAIVLINKKRLYQHSAKREVEDSTNGWVKELLFSHPECGYYAVRRTAKKYNIPVFKTFEKALDFVITKMIC